MSADLTWSVQVQARLGALRTTWTQGPLSPDGNGTLTAVVVAPATAFLDALAEDYVTTLDVRLMGTDHGGVARVELVAPPAFLAWPNGASASPVVWDLATMQDEAPKGVVDDAVRDALGDIDHLDRVMPPISFTTPPPADDDVVEGG